MKKQKCERLLLMSQIHPGSPHACTDLIQDQTKVVVTYIEAVSNSQLWLESKQILTISLLCKIKVWSEMGTQFIYLYERERELGGPREQSSFTTPIL